MNFHHTTFLQSASSLKSSPPDLGREIAFIGRSNSGKSSAINALVNQKSLARTSKLPGRTQLLNYFQVLDSPYRLVDLPGYGFAKVPQRIRQQIESVVNAYLSERHCLKGLILLIDCRRELNEADKLMLTFAQEANIAVHILLTKSDKLSKSVAAQALLRLKAQLNPQISIQLFSALTKYGIQEAQAQLCHWFHHEDIGS